MDPPAGRPASFRPIDARMASGHVTRAADGPWWESRVYQRVLLILLAVPLLWPAIPPLADVPGHIARFAIAEHYRDWPSLSRYYDFHWRLIGNLGVDLLVYPLAKLIGVEPATKLVILAIPVVFGAGLLACAREGHGRLPATAPLALIFAYAFPFHYGFVNFYLAVGLGLCAFPLWLRLTREHRRLLRFALFLPIAAGVWLAHAIGWIVLVVLCGVSLFRVELTRGTGFARALGATALGSLSLAAPLLPALIQARSAQTGGTWGWFEPREIVKWALMVDRDRWLVLDVGFTAVSALLLLAALTRRGRLTVAPELGWPALALGALFLVTPRWVGGAAYVGSRLLAIAAPVALIAIGTQAAAPRLRAALAWGAAGLFGLRMVATAVSLNLAAAANEANLAALAALPAGSAVATFSPLPCRPTASTWYLSRAYHLGGIAVSRRGAFANDQWEIDGVQPLKVRVLAAGEFRHDPSETVTLEPCPGRGLRDIESAIGALPRRAFDYVWLIDIPAAARPRRAWLIPVFANQATALYRIARTDQRQ